jgi:hypothetical protein
VRLVLGGDEVRSLDVLASDSGVAASGSVGPLPGFARTNERGRVVGP